MQNFPVTSQKEASLVVDILNDPRHAPVPQLQGHLLAGQIRQTAAASGDMVATTIKSKVGWIQLAVSYHFEGQVTGILVCGQVPALDPGPGVNLFVTSVHDRRQLVVIHDQSRQITGRRDGDEWYTNFFRIVLSRRFPQILLAKVVLNGLGPRISLAELLSRNFLSNHSQKSKKLVKYSSEDF